MRVLVTGGAGYIGSHAVRELAARGHEVVIYDNLSTGYKFLARGFQIIEGDVRDSSQLHSALRGADAVMHFAAHACVGESVQNPRKYFDNNVLGGLTLLNAALNTGVRTFIFSSTCAVYGLPERVPIPEDNPRRPVSPYGTSKLFFEHALEAYAEAYGLRYVALRYFNAAGAHASGEIGEAHNPETHLIPLALEAARGHGTVLEIYGMDYPTPDGTCVRDYIHVSDLAEAHVLALDYLQARGASAAVNLGTGTGYSVKEVLSAVERITGRSVPQRVVGRRAGDPAALVADSARGQAMLHWRPTRSLDDIVESAWRWHQHLHSRAEETGSGG